LWHEIGSAARDKILAKVGLRLNSFPNNIRDLADLFLLMERVDTIAPCSPFAFDNNMGEVLISKALATSLTTS
jgi:hypothetical protein